MKTNCKSIGNCQVKLTVSLDAEEMGAIVKEVERTFVREAQIPGFRKGKVPIEIIRRQFADGLKQETEGLMVRKHYAEAVKAEKIDEVALMGLEDFSHDEKGGSFTATVDVKPVFKLPTYKGLKVEFKDAKVEDSAVKEQLERLRVGYATYQDATDGVAAEGDFVQIDYDGTVDGRSILEIAPDAKIVAEGRGFWTQIEEGRFLPEILDAVKGMKAGETKEGVKAKFSKEAAPEGLKGAKAVYKVTLKAFRRRILPSDAELAEKAKAESIEKLEAQIREAMEKRAVEVETARRENQAIELLMRKVDFDVPRSQVLNAMDGVLEEFRQRAIMTGMDPAQLEQNRDKIRQEAEDAATQRVRLWHVFDAIAAAEKIEAKDEEKGRKVVEFILANAKK